MQTTGNHYHTPLSPEAVNQLNALGLSETDCTVNEDNLAQTFLLAIDRHNKAFCVADLENIPAGSVFTTLNDVQEWAS